MAYFLAGALAFLGDLGLAAFFFGDLAFLGDLDFFATPADFFFGDFGLAAFLAPAAFFGDLAFFGFDDGVDGAGAAGAKQYANIRINEKSSNNININFFALFEY